MGGFSIWHILILAVLVLLLFGGNRFSNMMGDLAKGMKQFKQGMADEDEDKQRRFDEQRRYEEQRRAEPPRLPREPDPIDVTARREESVAPPRNPDDR